MIKNLENMNIFMMIIFYVKKYLYIYIYKYNYIKNNNYIIFQFYQSTKYILI